MFGCPVISTKKRARPQSTHCTATQHTTTQHAAHTNTTTPPPPHLHPALPLLRLRPVQQQRRAHGRAARPAGDGDERHKDEEEHVAAVRLRVVAFWFVCWVFCCVFVGCCGVLCVSWHTKNNARTKKQRQQQTNKQNTKQKHKQRQQPQKTLKKHSRVLFLLD